MTNIEDVNSIKDRLRTAAKNWTGEPLSRGEKGALIGHLNNIAGSDSMRRLVLDIWFRHNDGEEIKGISTKELKDGEWGTIQKVADAFKYEGQWLVSGEFQKIIEQTKSYIIFKLS